MEIFKKPRVIAMTVTIILLMLLHNVSIIAGLILEVVAVASEKFVTEKEKDSN